MGIRAEHKGAKELQEEGESGSREQHTLSHTKGSRQADEGRGKGRRCSRRRKNWQGIAISPLLLSFFGQKYMTIIHLIVATRREHNGERNRNPLTQRVGESARHALSRTTVPLSRPCACDGSCSRVARDARALDGEDESSCLGLSHTPFSCCRCRSLVTTDVADTTTVLTRYVGGGVKRMAFFARTHETRSERDISPSINPFETCEMQREREGGYTPAREMEEASGERGRGRKGEKVKVLVDTKAHPHANIHQDLQGSVLLYNSEKPANLSHLLCLRRRLSLLKCGPVSRGSRGASVAANRDIATRTEWQSRSSVQVSLSLSQVFIRDKK